MATQTHVGRLSTLDTKPRQVLTPRPSNSHTRTRHPICRNAAALVRADTAVDSLATKDSRAPRARRVAPFRASTRPAPSLAWVRCQPFRNTFLQSITLTNAHLYTNMQRHTVFSREQFLASGDRHPKNLASCQGSANLGSDALLVFARHPAFYSPSVLEPCALCAENCTWNCPHEAGSCRLPCGAPCVRLPCDMCVMREVRGRLAKMY